MTWCKDTARDAAVRAAEDGRSGPLPTLAQAIAAPFACPACGGFGMDHRCRESCEKCALGGMTTERVTLEITTFVGCVPAGWPWREIMGGMAWIHPEESVRVVDGPKLAPHANDDGEANHAAQAASGGGEGEAVDQKPGFYAYENCVGIVAFSKHHLGEVAGCKAVPLYRQPPQPRGWLTSEEREALRYASQGLREAGGISNVQAMKQIDSLLARSSPPEVVLPDWVMMCVSHDRQNQLRKALAAAGVAVKEVGSD